MRDKRWEKENDCFSATSLEWQTFRSCSQLTFQLLRLFLWKFALSWSNWSITCALLSPSLELCDLHLFPFTCLMLVWLLIGSFHLRAAHIPDDSLANHHLWIDASLTVTCLICSGAQSEQQSQVSRWSWTRSFRSQLSKLYTLRRRKVIDRHDNNTRRSVGFPLLV